MKRLLVGDSREEILSTLEVILKHWGYRPVMCSRPEQIMEFLKETSPDLLILGRRLLTEGDSPFAEAVAGKLGSDDCALIVLGEPEVGETLDLPHEALSVPINVFALYALIQKHVEKHPRQNLRLAVKLPGMFCSGQTCQLGEVLSLSTRGLFVKTGARMSQDDELTVTFPLMGMKRELELDGRVRYVIEPGPENNYLQGAGIEFTPMDEKTESALKHFIECCFLGDLSASQRGSEGLDPEQIRNIAPELTLRLTRAR